MADKPLPEEPLARSIRNAAKKVGGLEALRKLTTLSSGTFYGLLSNAKAQRNPTRSTLQKLADAGVRVPSLFRKAA